MSEITLKDLEQLVSDLAQAQGRSREFAISYFNGKISYCVAADTFASPGLAIAAAKRAIEHAAYLEKRSRENKLERRADLLAELKKLEAEL